MNLAVILALVIAWGGSVAGAFFYGEGVGEDRIVAKQAAVSNAIRETREAAQQGAADAIAKLKPRNTTIVQKTEREVRENTVYADCRVPASGVQLANQALTGQPAEPAGGEQLPAAGAAGR